MTTTRPAQPDDINFIYDSFLKSFRYDSSVGKSCSNSIFFDKYRFVIDSILSRANVLIACLSAEPNVILGYLIYEPGVIHYAFVKEHWRRFGIFKYLITQSFEDAKNLSYTHRTFSVEPILRNHPDLTYNPFLLYNTLK